MLFFFSSRRRHTRSKRDWSSDVCSSDLCATACQKRCHIAVYQAFDTQDKPLTLGLGNDAIWQRFWQAVAQPAKGTDPRHAKNRSEERRVGKECGARG